MGKYIRSYFLYIYIWVTDLLSYSSQNIYIIHLRKKWENIYFFFVILISFDSINSLMPPLFRKFNVEIVNKLGFNKKLKVHCKSGSHDFPITYLNIGESFQFKFTILLTTLYWCNLWQVKDVYTFSRHM